MTKVAVDARFLWAVVLAAAAAMPAARGLWLNMPSSGQKCVFEELQSNAVVMGDFYSFYGDGDVNYTVNPSLTVQVLSPSGSNLYQKQGVRHGQFAFTTNEPGNYMACFEVDNRDQSSKTVTVGLEWKIGIATKDWDSIAKKEKIEGLDLELEKLQSYVNAISEKMLELMRREMKTKVLNMETNARVARYSQASLGLCILVSALQIWYLRRYFRKKKLI